MRILLLFLMLISLLKFVSMIPLENHMYQRQLSRHDINEANYNNDQQLRQKRAGCNVGWNDRKEGDCSTLIDTKSSAKEKATNIAQKAAAEAKAASDAQTDAANEAAVQVKCQLADKAFQAAKAAEAAMAGKQQMVEQLQNEIKEAEGLREQEEQAVQNAQNNLNAVQSSAQQAQNAIIVINNVMEMARQNAKCWDQVSATAQQELVERTQHHEIAKNHIEQLLKKLGLAREDLERTKQAACRAAMAAKKAQENAGTRQHKRRAWQQNADVPLQKGNLRPLRRLRRRRRRRRRPEKINIDQQQQHN